jgi:hypothetical protein
MPENIYNMIINDTASLLKYIGNQRHEVDMGENVGEMLPSKWRGSGDLPQKNYLTLVSSQKIYVKKC